jgi:hypothetical protein
MTLNWTAICQQLQDQPVQRRLDNANVFSYLLVAMFVVLVLVSAVDLYKLFRHDSSGTWRLHKLFLGTGLCGSGVGIGTWICYRNALFSGINALAVQRGPTPLDALSYSSSNLFWEGRYQIFYSLQFCLLSLSKLLVLDRLIQFFLSSCSAAVQYRTRIAINVVLAAVTLGITAMVSVSIVAATKAQEASSAFANADTLFRESLFSPAAFQELQRALLLVDEFRKMQAVTFALEVSLLVVIIAAFVAAGLMSLRRIEDALNVSLQVCAEPVLMD